MRGLLHDDAVVFGGRYKDASPVLRRSMAADCLKAFERPGDKGFYEACPLRSTAASPASAFLDDAVAALSRRSWPGAGVP